MTQPGGGPAEGAQVELVSAGNGQTYRTSAGARGRFYLDNLQPGPGYTLTVRAIGFSPVTRTGLSLALGQRLTVDVTLQPEAVQLEEVQVTAQADPLINAARTGPGAADLGQRDRAAAAPGPQLHRPDPDQPAGRGHLRGRTEQPLQQPADRRRGQQRRVRPGRGRLARRPGRAKPISVEAIKEFEVLVAPFDVRQGSFTGGLINTSPSPAPTSGGVGVRLLPGQGPRGVPRRPDLPRTLGQTVRRLARRAHRPRPAALLHGRGHPGPVRAVLLQFQSHRRRRRRPRPRRLHLGRRRTGSATCSRATG